jgi:MFS family permease
LTTFAKVLATVMFWGTIFLLLSQTYRGPIYDVGQRRYLVRGLWLAGPFLSTLAVGLLISTFGQSNLVFVLGTIPAAICWLLAIALPYKWINEHRRSRTRKISLHEEQIEKPSFRFNGGGD